jgi:hypothetical protein
MSNYEALISQTRFRRIESREDLIGMEVLLTKDREPY